MLRVWEAQERAMGMVSDGELCFEAWEASSAVSSLGRASVFTAKAAPGALASARFAEMTYSSDTTSMTCGLVGAAVNVASAVTSTSAVMFPSKRSCEASHSNFQSNHQ